MSTPATIRDFDGQNDLGIRRGPWYTKQSGIDLSVVSKTLGEEKIKQSDESRLAGTFDM
jgi:hypothetical protein